MPVEPLPCGHRDNGSPPDEAQARYLAHQARKKETLIEIMRQRHSDRMYDARPVQEDLRAQVREAIDLCPSSCDRRGVGAVEVDSRDELALLGGLLVGGVGWIHRAPWVLLLMAREETYKAPGEVEFMPYLDAGAVIQQVMLRATDLGLATAYVNPNIRQFNRDHFRRIFGDGIFCGALAIGHPVPGSPDQRHHQEKMAAAAPQREPSSDDQPEAVR